LDRGTSRERRRLRRLDGLYLGVLLLLMLGAPVGAAEGHGAAVRTLGFDGRTVRVSASWPVYRLDRHPEMCVRLDRRAVYLGVPSSSQRCPANAIGKRRAIVVEPRSAARASALPTAPQRPAWASASGAVFTGLGFDACSAPSTRAMEAWQESPYRAIGVYIGGINRACSQPNLTPNWVAAETAADWHLIPTYVGLQAPTSACSSCAKLSASQATAQGAAAAVDAVERAGEVAIGPGSPIYFDMESYSRTSSASSATLAFLAAWTTKLHALGYVSGVYSSSASGIADLADQWGSGYAVPDDLWIANWNGAANTVDPEVPSTAWPSHQRIHQYRGGHNESYGGVSINIDNNYVDGATVGTATLASEDPIGFVDLAKSPAPGQVRVRGWAFDPNAPTAPLSVRLVVGGKAGEPGAIAYELGAIATRGRHDVAAQYPEAGARHGFDLTLPTVKSGRQRLCAYALDIDPGEDRLLGCKGTTIQVPIKVTGIKAGAKRVRLQLTCLWPAGSDCPGQVALRSRFRVPVRIRGRGAGTRPVSRVLGRIPFRLGGGDSHTYRVPLTAAARTLLRQRGSLKTQVVVAIPGGRRVKVIGLRG
jgi:hypothetical protein